MSAPLRAEEILSRVRAVPPGVTGRPRTEVAVAGHEAGRTLAECDDPDVPWQRVVHADGSLAKGARQRRLLEAEGVPFQGARVKMSVARVPAEALDELAG